jgi:diguanylate cyclase (GGDEF)-like protein
MVGASVADVIGAPAGDVQLALAEARGGREAEIETGPGPSVRCLPLRAEPGKDDLMLVVISDGAAQNGEVEALRTRARDLETIAGATGALARSTEPADARRTICDTAVKVAGADVAAFLELAEAEADLVVAAATIPEMEGRRVPIEGAAMASRALGAGDLCFASEVREDLASWPLEGAGTTGAAWQPVRRQAGIREVVAVGWSVSPVPGLDRLRGSLAHLAAEAAVALDRAHALVQLSDMARTDPLTELSNRRAWQEELAREMAKAERGGQRLSIGLIDLDELKGYNDRWGHAAGDRVLLTAAARWRRRLRLTDLLARIGGDEFAVAMPNCGLDEAVVVGDELRGALPDGLTCSVGVAEWSVGESASELLSRADEALYAAKNAGRNSTRSVPGAAGANAGGSVPSS